MQYHTPEVVHSALEGRPERYLGWQIMFIAFMTVATEMIVAWDHGVMSVVFSVRQCSKDTLKSIMFKLGGR